MVGRSTVTPLSRFNASYIPEPNSGCWLWTGGLFSEERTYGKFFLRGKRVRAHRFAYEALVATIPGGLSVLHKCDIPSCVNPDHLFIGTQADNMADMCRKGRRAPSPSKLTPAQVRTIASSRLGSRVLSDTYGVTQQHIGRIRRGQSPKTAAIAA